MAAQGRAGVLHANKTSYHNMCRFNSGFFYDHPLLQRYKWYWRVEPNVRFTCRITYDPFVEMASHNKIYGYVMALWEVENTGRVNVFSYSICLPQNIVSVDVDRRKRKKEDRKFLPSLP